MRLACPVESAILLVIVLAAAASAREIGHVWAEEPDPTISVTWASTFRSSEDGEGKSQSDLVAIGSPDRVARAGSLGVQARGSPATSSAAALLAWIATATRDSSVLDTLPDVVALTEADFNLYLCEQVEQCYLAMPSREILAFFDFESRAIYISEGSMPMTSSTSQRWCARWFTSSRPLRVAAAAAAACRPKRRARWRIAGARPAVFQPPR